LLFFIHLVRISIIKQREAPIGFKLLATEPELLIGRCSKSSHNFWARIRNWRFTWSSKMRDS